MIEQILKEVFSLKMNSKQRNIDVDVEEKTEPFVLSDANSCNICNENPKTKYRTDCNREILKINNSEVPLIIVNYEKYISQFNISTGKCDYIITERGNLHEKIVFCELTCSNEIYVEPNDGIYPEGKRAKARKQMTESIKHFVSQQGVIEQYILTFPEKICIFGWRDYEATNNSNDEEVKRNLGNMQIFKKISDKITQDVQIEDNIMNHGFKFVQIKYPTEYKWRNK